MLADDLAATVFYKAIDASRRGHGCRDASRARSWLYQIAHNVWYDHLRPKFRAQMVIEMEFAEHVAHHDDYALDPASPLLARAERQLVPAQAEIVALELQGYSMAEIAARQGKTLGAVKTMRHRALVNLRALMAAAPG